MLINGVEKGMLPRFQSRSHSLRECVYLTSFWAWYCLHLWYTSRGDPRCWFWIITRRQVISRWQIICPLALSIKNHPLQYLAKTYGNPAQISGNPEQISGNSDIILGGWNSVPYAISPFSPNSPAAIYGYSGLILATLSKHSGNPEQTEGLILTWP